MRYFKYKGPKSTEMKAHKVQYAALTKEEKRRARKSDFLAGLAPVVFFAFFGGGFLLCMWGLKHIPIPKSIILAILRYIGVIILGIGGFLVSCILGAIASTPIYSKVDRVEKNITRKITSQACEHLRKFYGLQEPCIVTKCYDASDENFKNHDVCIFVVGDELRITTNLKNGFVHREKDLGCYAFGMDEISLTKIEGEKFLMAELKANETTFLLGYRAKGFIERKFLFKDDTPETQ